MVNHRRNITCEVYFQFSVRGFQTISIVLMGIAAVHCPGLRFSALAVGVSRADRVPADPIIGRLIVDGKPISATVVVEPLSRPAGTTIRKQRIP